jgi:hypothetical protein
MKATRTLVIALAAASLAGCAASTVSGPVEVTRFHLGAPLERGTITVEPMQGGGPPSLEFSTYAGAVQAELLQSGYSEAPPHSNGQYLAVVGFTRTTVEGAPRPAPFSVGIGGGSYGGGVGLGGGVSFPIGKRKSRYVVATELSVQIRRRSDGTVIWEGRAQTQADDRAPEAQASVAAGKLAHALFLGFPGESGRSITVR